MKKQIEVVPENFEAVHTAVDQIMDDGKKRARGKCGVHKTVNSHSSLHCCGCSCTFSCYVII